MREMQLKLHMVTIESFVAEEHFLWKLERALDLLSHLGVLTQLKNCGTVNKEKKFAILKNACKNIL